MRVYNSMWFLSYTEIFPYAIDVSTRQTVTAMPMSEIPRTLKAAAALGLAEGAGEGQRQRGNGKADEGDSSDANGCGSGQGWLKALEKGNGKKLGLYKKLGKTFGDSSGSSPEIASLFETGKIEHLLAAIDNIVNGEVNLPPGDQTKLFERIRQVGKGYTVVGDELYV